MPLTTNTEPRPTTSADASPAESAAATWPGPAGWRGEVPSRFAARRTEEVSPWPRVALAAVLLAHAAGLAYLRMLSEPRVAAPALIERLTVIDLAVAPPPPPSPPPARASRTAAATAARASTPAPRRTAVIPVASAPEIDASPARLRLFAPDGSLGALAADSGVVPGVGDARRFQFERPGIAAARSAFERPATIAHEPTRFDGGFRPSQDILTDALERAVKASTIVVMVPVPGAPGYKVGCGIVLLAAAGGCGYTSPKPLLYADDPATLDADEAADCARLWARISDERASQDDVRLLQKVYELACRKPLAADGDARRPR